MHNPSLTKEPRYEPAGVIPVTQDFSLLNWLAATGRLIPRDQEERENVLDQEGEISDLMYVDDHIYDEDEEELEVDDGDGDSDSD